MTPDAGSMLHSIEFADLTSFVRWCEADRAKYAYPHECSELRRSGSELFAYLRAEDDLR
jgi:hypothetical protein